MSQRVGLWRFHRADVILLGMTALQLGATTLWALSFNELPWYVNLTLFGVMTWFHFYNTIVATHSFIHCPYFTSPALNRTFSVVNSMNLFVPQVLYKFHHILHHRFNNDPVDGETGTTLDPSSTYRHGTGGQHENVWRYCLLGIFRGTSFAYDEVKRRRELPQYYLELAFIVAAAGALIAIDWKFFVFAFAPMFYVSWCFTHVENYYDHYRCADPRNPYSNSVSYYGRLFNLVYFNEGYHQEHHVAPACHWTKRAELAEELKEKLETAGCKPARFPSLLGFLEKA